jgi:hypothetical protein
VSTHEKSTVCSGGVPLPELAGGGQGAQVVQRLLPERLVLAAVDLSEAHRVGAAVGVDASEVEPGRLVVLAHELEAGHRGGVVVAVGLDGDALGRDGHELVVTVGDLEQGQGPDVAVEGREQGPVADVGRQVLDVVLELDLAPLHLLTADELPDLGAAEGVDDVGARDGHVDAVVGHRHGVAVVLAGRVQLGHLVVADDVDVPLGLAAVEDHLVDVAVGTANLAVAGQEGVDVVGLDLLGPGGDLAGALVTGHHGLAAAGRDDLGVAEVLAEVDAGLVLLDAGDRLADLAAVDGGDVDVALLELVGVGVGVEQVGVVTVGQDRSGVDAVAVELVLHPGVHLVVGAGDRVDQGAGQGDGGLDLEGDVVELDLARELGAARGCGEEKSDDGREADELHE